MGVEATCLGQKVRTAYVSVNPDIVASWLSHNGCSRPEWGSPTRLVTSQNNTLLLGLALVTLQLLWLDKCCLGKDFSKWSVVQTTFHHSWWLSRSAVMLVVQRPILLSLRPFIRHQDKVVNYTHTVWFCSSSHSGNNYFLCFLLISISCRSSSSAWWKE